MIHFDRQIAFGFTLDLSPQHHADSRRYIDIVKGELIDFATKLGMNCRLYVGHPDNNHMPKQQGESVAALESYAEPTNYRAGDCLMQVLDMLASQDADEKYVILVTDRYTTKSRKQFEIPVRLNETSRHGCEFIFVGIGDKYDDESLGEFRGHGCEVFHLPGPVGLSETITKKIGV